MFRCSCTCNAAHSGDSVSSGISLAYARMEVGVLSTPPTSFLGIYPGSYLTHTHYQKTPGARAVTLMILSQSGAPFCTVRQGGTIPSLQRICEVALVFQAIARTHVPTKPQSSSVDAQFTAAPPNCAREAKASAGMAILQSLQRGGSGLLSALRCSGITQRLASTDAKALQKSEETKGSTITVGDGAAFEGDLRWPPSFDAPGPTLAARAAMRTNIWQ